MALRIVLAVIIGGAIGLGVGMAGRALGGQCPLLCNPYVATGLGVVVALLLASRAGGAEALLTSENLVRVDSPETYERAVGPSAGVALVAFYTRHCPSCHRQLRAVSRLADRFAGRATVAVVDANAVPAVAGEEGIRAVPTMLLYRDGEQVRRFSGVTDEEELAARVDELLETSEPSPQDGR
ncbi:MAG: thioredoxin family protein [Armatimonadota bacterium]|jgi:thiol-disulfide isomerase/thioredoxin